MFPAGTTLITNKGSRDIRRLDGDESIQVLTATGEVEFRPIKRVFMGNPPGKVFCVSTSSERHFCATPDHPFAYGLEASRHYHDLFLAKREGLGFFLVTGNGMFRDSMETRILFKRQEPASKESVWLLSSHSSSHAAVYEQSLLSCHYGIPMFPSGTRKGERTLPEEMFRRLLIEVNTFARARRMLADHHLDEELPHWLMRALPESELPHRHFLDVIYFGGEQGRHLLSEHPLGENLRITGERLRNLMTRQRRTEEARDRFSVEERIEATRKDAYGDIQERVRLGQGKPMFLMPLAYARPGMHCTVVTDDGIREERIEEALLEKYEGPVYGIEIEGEEPIVAGGVVMGLHPCRGTRAASSSSYEIDGDQAKGRTPP